MRYLARRSRAWRNVSWGLMVTTDLVIHWDTSMEKVLHLSVWSLPFDREKLGIGPLVGGMPLVRALEGAADTLGKFLVGSRDDNATFGFTDLDNTLQRIDPFGAGFFVVDEPQNFVSVRGEKGARLQGDF